MGLSQLTTSFIGVPSQAIPQIGYWIYGSTWIKCPSTPYIPRAVSTSGLNTSGEPSVLTSLAYQTPLLREPLSPKGLAAYFQDGFRA